MFYVYIIKSLVKAWYYIGLTGNIDQRLSRHNNGRERTTKYYLPFELVFVQECEDRLIARDLEKYLKIRSNKESLLYLIAEVVKLVDTQS